jgi:hypothetical protein
VTVPEERFYDGALTADDARQHWTKCDLCAEYDDDVDVDLVLEPPAPRLDGGEAA